MNLQTKLLLDSTKADTEDIKQEIATMKTEINTNFEWIKKVLVGLCVAASLAFIKYIFS